jgi:hypothetical protein
MTPTAAAMTQMMQIADQLDDLEVQIDYVRRTTGDQAHVAKLQQLMTTMMVSLESAWDAWNDAMLAERLALV